MLIPKQNRQAIYEYLFKEGVIVAKKDFAAPKHPDVDVPNLQVIKALQSLKSRGYVTEQFSWRHYYWTLTNEGIQYLRDFLHIPAEIVPSTLVRKAPAASAQPARPARAARPAGAMGGESRHEYRQRAGDKKANVGAGTQDIEFRAGGRGRPAPRQ